MWQSIHFPMLGPTCLYSFLSDRFAFLRGHGYQASFAAYPAAFASHSGHDAGYIRIGYFGWKLLPILGLGQMAHHLVRGLIHVGGFAYALWHEHSIAG
jgi:hypothetical protein